jgi:hypothetical protein
VPALQDRGFTLPAIQRSLARIPLNASAEDLAVQRARLNPGHRASAGPPLEAVVRGFHRAADQVITRSLAEGAAVGGQSPRARRERARPPCRLTALL